MGVLHGTSPQRFEGRPHMGQELTTFTLTPQGTLQIALTDAGREFLCDDVGFDGEGQLREEARDRYDPARTLDELFEYHLANGWETTSSQEIGALVSEDAPMVSDSLVRDDEGAVLWYRALYWYEPYAILDPVAQLAKEEGRRTITFSAVRDLTWAGQSVDMTRQDDGSLLLEPTEAGRAWLAEDAFEYPQFDELIEDHLGKNWSYHQEGAPGSSITHTVWNPWDGAFTFQGSPQEALDQQGRVVFLPLTAPAAPTRA